MDAKKLINWLGHKADECGRKLDEIEDEYTAEYGYWDGYMECCNQLITKIKKGEFKDED